MSYISYIYNIYLLAFQENGDSAVGGHTDINGGYFIFSFKDSKMKIVNISPAQQKIINVIIKRHCRVTREGWQHGRSMTYFFKESQRKILKIVIF